MSDSPIGCLYCRKNISPLRKLKDPHFCCDEHRKKGASKSARALREAEDVYGFGSTITPSKPEDKSERRAGFGGIIFVGVTIVVLLLGLSRPAADMSRGASVEDILGVAAIVGLQAIEYRKLYPETEEQLAER